LAEHLRAERIDREHHHEQRHAAVGQERAHQHDGQDGPPRPQQLHDGGHDGAREARQLDELAEHGAQKEHRKVELDEAHHLFHEQPGKDDRNGSRIGEEHRPDGGDWREQDDAEAAIGHEHQEEQRRKADDEAHRRQIQGMNEWRERRDPTSRLVETRRG